MSCLLPVLLFVGACYFVIRRMSQKGAGGLMSTPLDMSQPLTLCPDTCGAPAPPPEFTSPGFDAEVSPEVHTCP